MRNLVSVIAVCLTLCVANTVRADSRTVSHGYYTEYAPEQRSSIVPNSQERIVSGVAGFYQGEFELKTVVESPRINCTAASSYPAEFFIEQNRRKIKIATPAGISLEGRIRKRENRTLPRRFRATIAFNDGDFRRRVTIRGRVHSEFDARVVSTEKVFIDRALACKFVHASMMARIFK